MIESILLVALGFLGAALLALLAAPVVWRRAVRLTRRRVEASIPISRSEIQADRDRLRADFAMTVRRLEMDVRSSGEKVTAQRIELDRQRDQIRALDADRQAGTERIAALEAEMHDLDGQRSKLAEEREAVSERLAEAEARIATLSGELDEMGRMYEEASYEASSRQITLVARESEIDRLSDEIGSLRTQRKEAERKMREAETAGKAAGENLESERKRAAALDAKLAAMMTTLSDREERLERREKELARLNDDTRASAERFGDVSGQLEKIRLTNAQLEDELERAGVQIATLEQHERELVGLRREIKQHSKRADAAVRLSDDQLHRITKLEEALERALNEITALAGQEKEVARLQRDLVVQTKRAEGLAGQVQALQQAGESVAAPANGALSDRSVLENRITALSRENRRLRAGLNGGAEQDADGDAGNGMLKDAINELAAQVVQLASLLDEPDSPLRKELTGGTAASAKAGGVSITSLADRVRALQKASASRVN